jgi:hypothetical protein
MVWYEVHIRQLVQEVNVRKILKSLLILSVSTMLLILFTSSNNFHNISLNKPDISSSSEKRINFICNISNWSYWVWNDGVCGLDRNGLSGGIYPRGTAGAIYEDGLWLGGYVDDGYQNPRFEGVYYASSLQRGWTENGRPVSKDDPRAQIYRIRPDWAMLYNPDNPNDNLEELRQDAAEFFLKNPADVTENEMQTLWELYRDHWENWPTDLGAPFYDNNNNGVYEPELGETPGLAGADQVLWFVTNDLDSGAVFKLSGSRPLGLEIRTTVWAYNQPTARLGQLIFKKFNLVNISGFRLDSLYIGQWCDPDVGFYGDDLVGCDTLRSLGYAYSGYPTDGDYAAYNLPPAAIGFDFFQGPMIPSPGDTAIFGLKKVPDHKNLPMTSFLYFAAGGAITDPPLGYSSYSTTLACYNMLRGFLPTDDIHAPDHYTIGSGPETGKPTKFPLSGDPVYRTGDLDGTGKNISPGDRRMGICSGPFSMEPGEEQEIVIAIVGGIITGEGGDNINSVAELKINDEMAQFMYDNLFVAAPRAPAPPKVTATPLKDRVVLEWGSNQQAVRMTEAPDTLLGFEFEGYNVYQLPNATATIDQAKLIATFDVKNDVTTIWGEKFVPQYKKVLRVPLQEGTNTGIQRQIIIDRDYIAGAPLFPGNSYYFAVTAYNYSNNPNLPEPSLESSLLPALIVTPQPEKPGIRYEGTVGETVTIEHKQGKSDALVQVQVIDPAATTGDDYEIFFTEDTDTNSASYGQLFWNVLNVDKNKVMVSDQPQMASLDEREDLPIFDGLQARVTGPELTFISFQVVRNANGPVDPTEIGCFAFNNNGFPFLFNSLYPDGIDRPDFTRQQSDSSTWGIHTGMTDFNDGTFNYFLARTTQNGSRWPVIIPYDFEIRFTYDPDNYGFEPLVFVTGDAAGGKLMAVPFELWNTGISTPDDPSDDYRMFPYILDSEGDGSFNLTAIDHSLSGGDNDPETDWFYWVIPEDRSPGESGYNAILSLIRSDVAGYPYLAGAAGDAIRRMVLVNWNGGSVSDSTFPVNVNSIMPEPGTVFRIISSKPNSTDDVFAFTAPTVTYSSATARVDVEKINVFPNPYYAYNSLEPDRFTKFVTFNHLPQKAVIRIFNLAGTQVRKLEKNNPDQFFRWDLKNQAGFPVASGMYIAYIDLPDLGKQKVLKIMILQAVEIIQAF